ncbi:hypothetical protein ACWDFH_07275 [Streptomyces kronopolitis]
MATYYRAKADRDLGRSEASRHGMQLVADGGGRLAPAARRSLARLAGDFPTAHAIARTLGWKGRESRCGESLEQRADRDSQFGPGEGGAEAWVDAIAEGKMRIDLSLGGEHFWLRTGSSPCWLNRYRPSRRCPRDDHARCLRVLQSDT